MIFRKRERLLLFGAVQIVIKDLNAWFLCEMNGMSVDHLLWYSHILGYLGWLGRNDERKKLAKTNNQQKCARGKKKSNQNLESWVLIKQIHFLESANQHVWTILNFNSVLDQNQEKRETWKWILFTEPWIFHGSWNQFVTNYYKKIKWNGNLTIFVVWLWVVDWLEIMGDKYEQ